MLAHIRLWKHLTTAPRAATPQGISETIRRAGLTKLAERLSDNSSGRPRILAAVRAEVVAQEVEAFFDPPDEGFVRALRTAYG
jgi:hypothetical protein